MRVFALGISAILAFATPAFAQTTNTNQQSSPSATGSTSSPAQNQNSATAIRPQVQQNLSKAGFTDINVMPESFLVRAKDPSGNPVMMVINPDSVTAVTYGAMGSARSQSGAIAQTNGTPNSGAGVQGMPGNKSGPAVNGKNSGNQSTGTTQEQDTSKIPGMAGNKSGPPAQKRNH
jgi:hypothetical protein